jgi:hypothetical protein
LLSIGIADNITNELIKSPKADTSRTYLCISFVTQKKYI